LPADFILADIQLPPLTAGRQNVQDVVKYLVEGNLRLRAFYRVAEVRLNETIKLLATDLVR